MTCTRIRHHYMAVVSCRWGTPLSSAAVQIIAHQIVLSLVSCMPFYVPVDVLPDIRPRNIWPIYKLCMPLSWHRLCRRKHSIQTSDMYDVWATIVYWRTNRFLRAAQIVADIVRSLSRQVRSYIIICCYADMPTNIRRPNLTWRRNIFRSCANTG